MKLRGVERAIVRRDGSQDRPSGLRRLSPSESLGVAREQPVVCIPVYEALEAFSRCVRSVLEHTPADVPILVADDASGDREIERLVATLAEAADHDVAYVRQPRNLGFVENVDTVLTMIAPGDAVLLNSDCVVAESWVELLRAAAYSDTTVATASALTNHGTILSVPERNEPQPDFPAGTDFDLAASTLRDLSLKLRPRIPTALGHCVYIRRAALDLVGGLDPAFSPGYGEEVDFSQRCILRGLGHVVADDVLVRHAAGASFGETGGSIRAEHEALINERYPYYARAVTAAATTETGPLPRALATAARAVRGTLVTIDARVLGPHVTGTQLHTLELIAAVWRTGRVALRVVVPRNVGEYAQKLFAELDEIQFLLADELDDSVEPSDVVHRPYQVFQVEDLLSLQRLGERMVVTHQDLIAYHNPGYFANADDWQEFQRVTRQTLALADRVVFFSGHAAQDALAEELVEPERVRVVYVGTDHRSTGGHESRRPRGLAGDRPFLLCLGTDFLHKNRVFALELLDELQRRHVWDGALVFAGPHAARGTSEEDERKLLAARPAVASAVVDLEAVDEAEKTWLLANAELVVYPTIYEGFGLIPFEAAQAGTACMFAAQTSLAEILPPVAATIVPWDASATADRAIELLRRPEARRALVETIRAASQRFTWDATGRALVDTYLETLRAPAPSARALWAGDQVALDGLRGIVASFPVDVQQALVALSSRRAVRPILFGSLKILYKLVYFARHLRPPPRL